MPAALKPPFVYCSPPLDRHARRFEFVHAAANNRAWCVDHVQLCKAHTCGGRIIVDGDNPWGTLYRHVAWGGGGYKAQRAQIPEMPPGKTTEKCGKIARWITGRAADCIP